MQGQLHRSAAMITKALCRLHWDVLVEVIAEVRVVLDLLVVVGIMFESGSWSCWTTSES